MTPFQRIQRYAAQRGLPVPRSKEAAHLILEDLTPAQRRRILKKGLPR